MVNKHKKDTVSVTRTIRIQILRKGAQAMVLMAQAMVLTAQAMVLMAQPTDLHSTPHLPCMHTMIHCKNRLSVVLTLTGMAICLFIRT